MAARERDLERLLTFVDAVVAIAITLLVLPLADVGSQIHDRSVAELLAEHTNDIFGFLLSFVVIARLWAAQHWIVRSLVRQSTAVMWLLLAWTLTIVFLPFPTTLVAATSDDNLAKVLYIGTMALSSALLALIEYTIGRDPRMRDSDEKIDIRQSIGTIVAFLLALAISVAIPATSYFPLLLLVLVDPVVRLLDRRR